MSYVTLNYKLNFDLPETVLAMFIDYLSFLVRFGKSKVYILSYSHKVPFLRLLFFLVKKLISVCVNSPGPARALCLTSHLETSCLTCLPFLSCVS